VQEETYPVYKKFHPLPLLLLGRIDISARLSHIRIPALWKTLVKPPSSKLFSK